MIKSDKKIVVIGGGTGVFTVLSGLKAWYKNLSAIVTMADNGGSTGILREEFGILPPGDVRRALIALSRSDNGVLAKLFNYRFSEGSGLQGHSFGNLMLTALERLTGGFPEAIREAGKILSVQGNVIPVTLKKTTLRARLEDGTEVRGEANINIPLHDGTLRISKVWLAPVADINLDARRAIMEADAVIIGPGDLYTSLVPNLLVRGVTAALKKSPAKKIYFVNLMTKFGETNKFQASHFLEAVERYLGRNVLDYVIVNSRRPGPMRFRPYANEKADFVINDLDESLTGPTPIVADLLRTRGFLRHDPQKVANIVRMLI